MKPKFYFIVKTSALLLCLSTMLTLSHSCKKDNNNPPGPGIDTTHHEDTSPFYGKPLTKRPIMVDYWGGCCYDRSTVGPLDAMPDGVDVVNIFTLGIGRTAAGGWEFEHRGVSGQNEWSDVLTKAHALQKRGIRIVATSFAGGLVKLSSAAADSMAKIVRDSLDKWKFDGIDLDLEYGNVRTANIDSSIIALSKYVGPVSKTGRILSVVDYNNYNLEQIKRSKQYIDYVMTMSYWNKAADVMKWVKSYGDGIGNRQNVLIGVGAGCAINAGQATIPGEELKIADTLKVSAPGSGMMEFIFGCSYHNKDQGGNITKDVSYTTNIIQRLKK
ncbi:EndoS/ChiA family endoglycosidase [Chitinophaga ginsengisoli]|uniref:mannosyl-glycoprotein endo-beta-N-acetylglucosaminidase n=1 Tax=Chitinophaga ginsengisoli TaxID=363837 RepID=A0A2P8GAC2_9BACT|nr:glycosyl hydrolase family 18 protein [Chitinophaga ginsengisoli]PSL30904.1 glycosyl hydrolase family 18 (putative chitinase) [Chitinophaga ginsengisoli]